MEFKEFKQKKALSLANLLSLEDEHLAQELSKTDYYYLSYLEDPMLNQERHIKSEIGAVSYAIALLGACHTPDIEPFANFDIGHLSGESNIGEEEAQSLAKWVFEKGNEAQIIIDQSFFHHQDKDFIFSTLQRLNLEVVLAGSKINKIQTQENEKEPKELESFDGSVVYLYKGKDSGTLRANSSWFAVAKVKEGQKIKLSSKDGFSAIVATKLDPSIKGTAALLCDNDFMGYNFKLVKVETA